MEFRILGPVEVVSDGQPIDLGGPRQRALLCLLVLEANRVIASERLIDALWEEEPPATARKALQVSVSQLRKVLGSGRVETTGPGYRLRVQEGEVDLERFQALQDEGRFEEALGLWRGPPLSDFASRQFAQAEIARLEELRFACLEERIDADLAAGRHAALAGEVEGLVAERPLRQRLRGQLMLALYRSGRDAEALEAYQEARRLLVDELGLEPRRELRELQQAILKQDPALDWAAEDAPGADSTRAFVGRDRELEELVGGLDDAFAARGRLFLLVGEPGIGKSRLADELGSRARSRGAHVLFGRCWEAGGAPAYWPWVQSLRAYIRETDRDALRRELGGGASDLAHLLPELRALFPDVPEPPALETEGARFRLFDAAASFLKSAAQARPVVLVLDDLHAADEPSLLLLQFLGRELEGSRLLVVGAYRDVDPALTGPLRETIAELVREPVTSRLQLSGLGADDVARYLEVASGDVPSEKLVTTIHTETEGNPLFVGEIVRLLTAEGSLDRSNAPTLTIPQSVQEVIARRLRRLPDECQYVLQLASILGREFALAALSQMAGVGEDELIETLDAPMSERVVLDAPGGRGRLRFAHMLIRDTLYQQLTSARRVALHRQALDALEAAYAAEPASHLAELAYHAVAAYDNEKGLSYAQLAGDRALALFAYEEAVRLYQLALEAFELRGKPEPERHCELLLTLGHAQVRAGSAVTAKQTFLEMAEVARRLHRHEMLARAALGYGGRFVWTRAGSDECLIPLLKEALAADQALEVGLRVCLMARLGAALRDELDMEPRARISQEAVELARATGDPATLAYALVARYAAVWSPATTRERLAISTEVVDLARKIGDKEREVEGHGFRLHALLELGDVDAAHADLAARAKLTNEMHQPAQLVVQLWLQTMGSLLAGDFQTADEAIHKAFELGGQATQSDEVRTCFELQRFVLRREQGRLVEIESSVENWANGLPARPVFRCALANLSAELGHPVEAQRRLASLARDNFDALPPDNEWLFGAAVLAETCALLDDRASSASLYRLLVPYAKQNVADGTEISTGAVSRYLGLLATVLQRWGDAVHHFEHAIDMNERMHARPWLAHAQEDYARMLLRNPSTTPDSERAEELLGAALSTYQELRMESYASRASATMRELNGR